MASESSRQLERLAASLEKTRRAESLATRTLEALAPTPTEPTGSLYLAAPCHDLNAPTLDLMTQWRPELTLGHAVLLNDTSPEQHPLVKPIATSLEADELIRTVTYAGTRLEFRVPSADPPALGDLWMLSGAGYEWLEVPSLLRLLGSWSEAEARERSSLATHAHPQLVCRCAADVAATVIPRLTSVGVTAHFTRHQDVQHLA